MVKLLGIDNVEYVGGTIVFLVLFYIIFRWFMGRGGRLSEEREEERETISLLEDEKKDERAQKDERNQCYILDGLFSEIMIILRKSGKNEIVDKIMESRKRISYMLKNLGREKMNVQRAFQAFRELHTRINEFLSHLPNDNQKMNSLVEQIKAHQQAYYKDLITELTMDESKKARLKKLWSEFIDEERGQGQTQAAA